MMYITRTYYEQLLSEAGNLKFWVGRYQSYVATASNGALKRRWLGEAKRCSDRLKDVDQELAAIEQSRDAA